MDEMISIDLPTTIDYIRELTNKTNVGYIGHSQGALKMFLLLSLNDHYSTIVKPFIALSPVLYVNDFRTPTRHARFFKDSLRSFPGAFLHMDHLRIAYSQLCSNQYLIEVCFNIYSYFLGTDRRNIDMGRLSVYMSNIPMGSSSRNAAHFFQMFEHGNPAYFDYGAAELNQAKYGMFTAPFYNVSNIASKDIALFYLKDDWFNPIINVNLLKDKLQEKLLDDYLVPIDTWNHMELIWSNQAGKIVNSRILQILGKYA